jgi:hypothetical protein
VGQVVGAGQLVDRVEDLDVARAAAEVGPQVAGCVVAREARSLLVEQGLGAHDDAGRAEPALQRAAGRERVGEAGALGLVEPFERDDRLALGPLHRHLAAHHRLAVEQHRAAAALARGRTAVLG